MKQQSDNIKPIRSVNKSNRCHQAILLYAVINTVTTFIIIIQTNQATSQAEVDISGLYIRTMFTSALLVWIAAIGIYLENITGYIMASLANLLLLIEGLNKLSIEWREASSFYEEKTNSQVIATLKYWTEYHNGIQEIPQLAITTMLLIYISYRITKSFINKPKQHINT